MARELARIAGEREFTLRSERKSPYNKNYKAYVFYSGSFYDDNIDEFLDSPVTYLYGSYDRSIRESINLADNNDIIINTVSIAAPYGANEYMDELVPKTGGKSYNDCDGIGTLINEVIKDLDDQKEAQRQGDYDGDGLSDGHELDGMIGDNGHIYYSNPYTTDVDHDTDHDHVPDNVEMGEYNPVTGRYKVLSDPNDPNSVPSDDDSEPVYIIGWSYGRGEVDQFEYDWITNDLFSEQYTKYGIPNGDEYNNDWTDEMWTEFIKTNSFSRAAQTKKNELIESGIDPKYIKVYQIDGVEDFYNLWNFNWTQYESIQELHLYSHGDRGNPSIYNGGLKDGAKEISDTSKYSMLPFTSDAKCYFYGCHTGYVPSGEDEEASLQKFADNQHVITYANRYYSNFSSEVEYRKRITDYDEKVYLYSYGIDGFCKPWKDAKELGKLSQGAAQWSGIFYEENKIDMVEFIPQK